MGEVKKILIIDDHPVSRDGITMLIETENDLSVCSHASSLEEAEKKIKELEPDLIILDLSLNGELDGLKLIKTVTSEDFGICCKILVLSMHDEKFYAERVIKAGALGYVMKKEPIDVILAAIRKVLSGGITISEKVSDQILKNIMNKRKPDIKKTSISDSELEVLLYLGKGYRPKEIASLLKHSVKNLEYICRCLREKTGSATLSELIKYAIQWRNPA